MVATTAVIPVMGIAVKMLHEQGVTTAEMLAWRSAMVLAVLLPALAWPSVRADLARAHKGAHVLHAVFGLSSMACIYWGLAYMPLVTATAISFTTPMFLAMLAIPILGERPRPLGWAALGVGLAGALVVLRPGSEGLDLAGAVVLLGAVLGACMLATIRRMPAQSSHFAVLFYYAAIGGAVFGGFHVLAAPGGRDWPPAAAWPALAALAVLALALQVLLTLAYRLASSSLVGGLDYLRLFWAALLGWAVFAEAPGPAEIAGMALIVGSGAVIALGEARSRSSPSPTRDPSGGRNDGSAPAS